MGLEDVLNDEADEPVEEPVDSEGEVIEEISEEPETEDDPAKKADDPEQGEPPAPKEVPLNALLDEREKRQRAQQDAAYMRNELAALQNREPVDPLEDFDGAFNERANSLLLSVDARFIDLTASLSRSQHDDYDEMESLFLQEAHENPSLIAQMNSSQNPAEFAYNHAKSRSELAEAGDLDALKAKIRQEIEAENLEKSKEDKNTRDSVPESLSGARASGKSTGKAQGGPTPFDNLF